MNPLEHTIPDAQYLQNRYGPIRAENPARQGRTIIPVQPIVRLPSPKPVNVPTIRPIGTNTVPVMPVINPVGTNVNTFVVPPIRSFTNILPFVPQTTNAVRVDMINPSIINPATGRTYLEERNEQRRNFPVATQPQPQLPQPPVGRLDMINPYTINPTTGRTYWEERTGQRQNLPVATPPLPVIPSLPNPYTVGLLTGQHVPINSPPRIRPPMPMMAMSTVQPMVPMSPMIPTVRPIVPVKL